MHFIQGTPTSTKYEAYMAILKSVLLLATGVDITQKVMTEKELHSFLTNYMLVQNTSVCERLTVVAVKNLITLNYGQQQ